MILFAPRFNIPCSSYKFSRHTSSTPSLAPNEIAALGQRTRSVEQSRRARSCRARGIAQWFKNVRTNAPQQHLTLLRLHRAHEHHQKRRQRARRDRRRRAPRASRRRPSPAPRSPLHTAATSLKNVSATCNLYPTPPPLASPNTPSPRTSPKRSVERPSVRPRIATQSPAPARQQTKLIHPVFIDPKELQHRPRARPRVRHRHLSIQRVHQRSHLIRHVQLRPKRARANTRRGPRVEDFLASSSSDVRPASHFETAAKALSRTRASLSASFFANDELMVGLARARARPAAAAGRVSKRARRSATRAGFTRAR